MDALLERLTIEDSDLRGQTQVNLHFTSFILTYSPSFIIYSNWSKKNRISTILSSMKSFVKFVSHSPFSFPWNFNHLQVTVECKERGELLSKLRDRYSSLLSRVPRQIKRFVSIKLLFSSESKENDDCFVSLHEELMAQRALDRRLAEQLIQFKSTVGTLMLYVEILLWFSSIYIDDFETIF